MPEVFATAGYTVLTLNDVFGPRRVSDTEWIEYADQRGMAVVCKDDKIRRRQDEKRALYYSDLRVLCLANGQLPRADQASYFQNNLERIDRLWRRQGPWVYAVYRDRLARVQLYDPER